VDDGNAGSAAGAAGAAGEWRRFERTSGGRTEYREVGRDGIRCLLRWGVEGGSGRAMTVVRDDERDAGRHVARKAREYLGKGFTEATGRAPASAARAGAGSGKVRPVLEVLPGGEAFLPVAGFDEVRHRRRSGLDPAAGFHEYLVLHDDGRAAISFTVRADAHDPEAVAVFLRFLDTRRDLPFDGSSHHKPRLATPVGRFTHALLCSPSLGGSHRAWPEIADRVASACPVFDCEIGDADTEVLVDARIHGHGAVRRAEWGRDPRPVVDLRHHVEPSFHAPSKKRFLVGTAGDLRSLLGALALPGVSPESWLEVRSFRGEVRRFTPGGAPAYEDLLPFLLGAG
jgi:hypothetical protein